MHVHLTFIPLGRSRFKAILSEDNTPMQTEEKVLASSSQTPLLSAARKLKALGYDEAIKITASHEGSDVIALASTVGHASRWSLSERDRDPMRYEPYKPRLVPMAHAEAPSIETIIRTSSASSTSKASIEGENAHAA